MDAVVSQIYEKIYVKGEQLSLGDKLKAKVFVAKLIAKNYRLIYKCRSLQKKTFKSLCDKCHFEIENIDTTLSLEEDYKMIDTKFCEHCKPRIKEYFDFMTKIKISDVKI